MPATRDGRRPVVELRVHGVHGTAPSVLLDDPSPVQIAGDDDARFYRSRSSAETPARGTQIEAFWWSRLTSGSPGNALWLLFLPFALLNLTRFMLPTWDDVADRSGGGRRRPWDRSAGGLLRVLGLAMTLGLLITTVTVTVGILVAQCVTRSECTDSVTWLEPFATWTAGQVLLLAIAPALFVMVLLEWVGTRSRLPRRPADTPPAVRWVRDRHFGDETFWEEAEETRVLRRLHLSGCLVVVGVLYAGGIPGAASTVLVTVGAVLLALVTFAVAGVQLLVARAPRFVVGSSLLTGFLYGATAVGATAWTFWSTPVRGDTAWPAVLLAGLDGATDVLGVGMLVLLTALTVTVGVVAARYRRAEGDAPRPVPFRPMWFGMGTAVVASIAVGLIGGFGTGVVFAVADWLGTVGPKPDLRTPPAAPEMVVVIGPMYSVAALLAGAAIVALMLLALPTVAFVLQRPWACLVWTGASAVAAAAAVGFLVGRTGTGQVLVAVAVAVLLAGAGVWTVESRRAPDGVPSPKDDYPDTMTTGTAAESSPDGVTEAPERTLARTWRSWMLGRSKYRFAVVAAVIALLFAAATVTGGVAAVVRLSVDGPAGAPEQTPLATFGAAATGFVLLALVSLGLTTYRSRTIRTGVGILWDLISFWPRVVHPLCPPPYGGKAVREVANRVTTLKRDGYVVVLSGHSQGSVICVAAVMVLSTRDGTARGEAGHPVLPHVGLLTYGSQLQWAFSRVFPCFLGYRHLRSVHERDLHGRWRSLFRETDPLGGPVISWCTPHGAGSSPVLYPGRQLLRDDHMGRAPEEPLPPESSQQVGGDHRLVDPVALERRPGDPGATTTRGHSGYYADPVFVEVRAGLEAEVGRAVPVEPG